MARNAIQFQAGLSMSAFLRRFGTEEQCEAAVRRWRWPQGFVCPKCGCKRHTITGKRRLHECRDCGRQTSLKAGTIFEKSLVPLTVWFQAIWHITQSKNSISTLELSRHLGLKWDSAWLMRQKLATVMAGAEQARKLDGRIEMDDAVLGGERHEDQGGKRGRGGPNKVPFVVAVSTSDDGKPRRVLLHVVKAHTKDAVAEMAKAHIAPGAIVVSDGLSCFPGVAEAGCRHERVVCASTGLSEELTCFRWVNTLLGNLKTAITGTFHAIRRPYVPPYFAEFQYRFNRRADLVAMLDQLASAAARANPRPYLTIKQADVGG